MSSLRSILLLSLFLYSINSRGQSCDSLFVTLFTGIWAEEVSWSISTLDGVVLASDGVYENFTNYEYAFCLPSGCYQLNMFDSFGDGWQGASFQAWNAGGILVVEGSLPDGFGDVVSFSQGGVCGCTDSAAANYDNVADFDDGSCSYCFDNEWSVVLYTGSYGNEISWIIQDLEGDVWSEGGNYPIDTNLSLEICLPDGCFTVELIDSWGDGWNGAWLQIVQSDGEIVVDETVVDGYGELFSFGQNGTCGCTDSTAVNYESSALYDNGLCAFCSSNMLGVSIFSGSYGNEISWLILDEFGIVLYSGGDYNNNSNISFNICLPDACYTIYLIDSSGDGWNDASMQIVGDAGGLLFEETLVQGYSVHYSFSPYAVCGCTDGAAINYNAAATTDDGSCLLCNDNPLSVEVSTVVWASEVTWDVTDDLGVVWFDGGPYMDYSDYSTLICLPDGCYHLNLHDSFGDGWQGAEITLFNSDEVILTNGTVPLSQFEATLAFTVNSDCEIPGCTFLQASNYNIWANIDDGSCSFISDNVELLGQWSDDSLVLNGLDGRYSEVYGAVVNEREYGIIGSTAGTHIIDITVPENSEEVAFIPGAFAGTGVIHRDYHTFHNYLYAVCQQGNSTLQIIDISNLPDTAMVVYDSDEIFSVAHNIFIDTTMSKLYAVSASGALFWSPLLVMDISNESAPVLLLNMQNELPSTHDIYVEKDTAYINVLGNGLMVYDFGPDIPQFLGSLTNYPDQGANHSGWLDRERELYVFADEIHGADLKVCDVADLTDIVVESTFNSDVDPQSIPHNLILRDNYVFLSYYHDGLQIFDISDPAAPQKAGYYDTYLPDNHNGFGGAWGVYPSLPSGNILISDIQSGLFVLKFTPDRLEICANDSVLIDGVFQNDPGVYIFNEVTDSLGYENIVVVELSQIELDYSETWLDLVFGDSLLINNSYIFQTGDYIDSLVNMWGCDSLVTIHVNLVDNISELLSFVDTKVYPNPVRGVFTVEFSNAKHESYRFELMDAEGKLVKMIAGIRNNKILVQTHDLPSGMFFYRLVGKDESYSGKLLIE